MAKTWVSIGRVSKLGLRLSADMELRWYGSMVGAAAFQARGVNSIPVTGFKVRAVSLRDVNLNVKYLCETPPKLC